MKLGVSCPICGSSNKLITYGEEVRCDRCRWSGSVTQLDHPEDVKAAYEFVQDWRDHATEVSGVRMWYGHALRDAYLAGVRAERNRHG